MDKQNEWSRLSTLMHRKYGSMHWGVRSRDYQKEKVYQAENSYIENSDMISHEEILGLVRQVSDAYGLDSPQVWFYDDMGPQGQGCDRYVVFDRVDGDKLHKGLVLHEMAHAINSVFSGEYDDGHGAMFSSYYLDMVRQFDAENVDMLEDGFREGEIETDPIAQHEAILERIEKKEERDTKTSEKNGQTAIRWAIHHSQRGYWADRISGFARDSIRDNTTYSTKERAESKRGNILAEKAYLIESDMQVVECECRYRNGRWVFHCRT